MAKMIDLLHYDWLKILGLEETLRLRYPIQYRIRSILEK